MWHLGDVRGVAVEPFPFGGIARPMSARQPFAHLSTTLDPGIRAICPMLLLLGLLRLLRLLRLLLPSQ